MKMFKSFLVFTILVVGVNSSNYAQNKEKQTIKKVEKTELQDQNTLEREQQRIQKLEAKMQSATPEERAQIEKKLRAYKEEMGNNGNAYGKNKGDISGKDFGEIRSREAQAKEKIDRAYLELKASKQKLDEAKIRIDRSEEDLNKAEKQGEISKEELAIKKEKLDKAKKEYDEAYSALVEQQKVISAKRATLKKTEE